MNEIVEPSSVDLEEIKRKITAAIRTAIRERADELGISYEAFIDLLLNKRA